MILRAFLFLALLAVAACGDFPRDPDGTLDRIRAQRQFKVGIIASAAPIGEDRQQLFLQRVSATAHAQPAIETGASESLLAKLEAGALDLVIGEMDAKTPWAKRITLLPPLGEQVGKEGHTHLAAMARNGENGWIALLHREASVVASLR